MPLIFPAFAAAGAIFFSASGPAAIHVQDVAAYDRVSFEDGPVLITAIIIEDSRCTRRDVCLKDNELVVGVVVLEEGRWHDALLPMGVEVPLKTGTITLDSSSTPPVDSGAIDLRKYRLNLTFKPYS